MTRKFNIIFNNVLNISVINFLLCLTFFLSSCEKQKTDDNQFILSGEIAPGFNNKYIYIYRNILEDNGIIHLKDSSLIKDNKFYFNGTLKYPSETTNLSIQNIMGGYTFVLDQGKNEIYIPKSNNENIFSNIVVPKSESNEIQKKYFEIYKANLDKYFELYDDLTNEGKKVKALSAEGIEKSNVEFLNYLKTHTHCFYTLHCLNDLFHKRPFDEHPAELMELYNQLDKKLQNSDLGLHFYKDYNDKIEALSKTNIGNSFPNFEMMDENGNTFSTKTLKGKPFVVAFSGTWCSACLAYEPTLLKYYHQYKSEGLEVVYINSDDNVDKWLKHIKEKKLDWINVSERKKSYQCEINKKFAILAYPTYIVVNKKNKIIYNTDLSKDGNNEKLEEFIKTALYENQ